MLSLSACDTAVETGEESGREVEGFAMLAQRLGAGAVLATPGRCRTRARAG